MTMCTYDKVMIYCAHSVELYMGELAIIYAMFGKDVYKNHTSTVRCLMIALAGRMAIEGDLYGTF